MNETVEILNDTEEAPEITIDYDNSYIQTMCGFDVDCIKGTNFRRQKSL